MRNSIWVLIACLTLGLNGLSAEIPKGQPVLWKVERGAAKVYIFGFADSKDASWLTPKVQRAFEESTELWTEGPADDEEAPVPPTSPPSRRDQGYDAARDLFEVLGPKIAHRTLEAAKRYGVPREQLEHVSPWRAYFIINNAYRAQRTHPDAMADLADEVLPPKAKASGKRLKSEFSTQADLTHFYRNMSDRVQAERLDFLLDYLDDETNGRNADEYDWIEGHKSDRIIERMRLKQPELYQVEHAKRNEWWAARISKMLSDGGVYFVLVGANHTVGPDSIPKSLQRLGLIPKRD